MWWLIMIVNDCVTGLYNYYTILLQFWKDHNIYNCNKNLAWAWDDVTKEWLSSIWKQTLKRFVQDFKGFARMRKLQKSVGLWLRWQTTLTWVWMRTTLRSSWTWFLRNWLMRSCWNTSWGTHRRNTWRKSKRKGNCSRRRTLKKIYREVLSRSFCTLQ